MKKAIDIIRKMNPDVYIPTGAEVAAALIEDDQTRRCGRHTVEDGACPEYNPKLTQCPKCGFRPASA